jgi:hypothetical protein
MEIRGFMKTHQTNTGIESYSTPLPLSSAKFMEHSPSREADSRSDIQTFPVFYGI